MDGKGIPFSSFGSYFTIDAERMTLRTISGNAQAKDVFSLEFTGLGAAPEAYREGTILKLGSGAAHAKVCFENADCIRFKAWGTEMVLSTIDDITMGCCAELRRGRWLFARLDCRLNIVLEALRGSLAADCPWDGTHSPAFHVRARPDADGVLELAVELYRAGCSFDRPHGMGFEQCADQSNGSFRDFLDKTLCLPQRYSQAREIAAYLNWSSVVSPEGWLKRPGMYMSKNWMCNVWSWDHCFNALALSALNPELAWDQFMVLFDVQDRTGVLPDCINNYDAVWQFCKPPVHGWTIAKMLKSNPFYTEKHIMEAYGPLCRWTDWWFNHRDSDGDGVPQYHHGNDSGWDNGTVFRLGTPVESPDLSALLVVQMDVLSGLAKRLGNYDESQNWKDRADGLLQRFLEHFVKEDGSLTARLSGSHEEVDCQCLLPYVSLILGERLPEPVRRSMVEHLRQSGLITAYGLATEPPSSQLYVDDGYWRGPIWAPSTMLVVEGLKACGEGELARELAQKFTDLCAEHGFAENFDACTGEGLRDPAYTWTSSVFLVMANEYLM